MKELKKSTLKEVFVTNKEDYKDYITEYGKNKFLFLDLTDFVYSPKFDVGVIYDIENNKYATDVNSEYRPILNENMEIDRVIKLIETDLQTYFKSLTISDYFTDYINEYMVDDGAKDFGKCIYLIEEEIYNNELFKTLLGNNFYDKLTHLFDSIGIEDLTIYKKDDGTFGVFVSSSYINKEYHLEEVEEDVNLGRIFVELYENLVKVLLKEINISMVACIEGIGDMVDTMKEDGFDEYTIKLDVLSNRDDNLTCLGFNFMNNKELIKTKKEKQMYQKYCELKNKYNFKEIIFDGEKHEVTFKF